MPRTTSAREHQMHETGEDLTSAACRRRRRRRNRCRNIAEHVMPTTTGAREHQMHETGEDLTQTASRRRKTAEASRRTRCASRRCWETTPPEEEEEEAAGAPQGSITSRAGIVQDRRSRPTTRRAERLHQPPADRVPHGDHGGNHGQRVRGVSEGELRGKHVELCQAHRERVAGSRPRGVIHPHR